MKQGVKVREIYSPGDREWASAIGNDGLVNKRRLITGRIQTTRNLLIFFTFKPFLTSTKHLKISFIVFYNLELESIGSLWCVFRVFWNRKSVVISSHPDILFLDHSLFIFASNQVFCSFLIWSMWFWIHTRVWSSSVLALKPIEPSNFTDMITVQGSSGPYQVIRYTSKMCPMVLQINSSEVN